MNAGFRLLGPAACAVLVSCGEQNEDVPPETGGTAPAAGIIQAIETLEAEAFTDEQEARRIENAGIVPLWDRLLAAKAAERLDVLADLPFQSLTLGKATAPAQHDLGVQTREVAPGGTTVDAAGWRSMIDEYKAAGYTLVHTDWHHAAFRRDEAGTAVSDVSFALQGIRTQGGIADRLEFKGILQVAWNESGDDLQPGTITVLKAGVTQRRGPAAFLTRAVIEGESKRPAERDDMGAVSVVDLDGDQYPEIILGNANRILWNKGDFQFEPGPIIPEGGTFFNSVVGIAADFNGDSIPDWLSDTAKGDLALWTGKPGGGFDPEARLISLGQYHLRVPSVLTAGDIDRDGDLDLFAGQWRSLYEKMPETFWDANDGFGNTLLRNDGSGGFTDATDAAGLQDKRFRRSYAASFLDLDDDRDLDLLVVSDFHGVDIHLNDGSGKFTESTSAAVDNPYSFGMSHTVADYNADGRADFYVLGMGSTTARRLERMQANPARFPEANKMRAVMGYGNRMYIAQAPGVYQAPSYLEQVSRTGWSWGSTSLDFDNDGDMDIYAANGHISGKTTRDYCSNFWCRDIYVLQDYPTREISGYLETLPEMETQSWDGYQVNPLLVNQSGDGFRNFGFALDVGFDFDCRRIISADLDLDGRVDLLVGRMEGTSGFFHDGKTAVAPPALLILQNILPEAAARNWIGVTLQGAPGVSPLGATITLTTSAGPRQAVVLSGDSFMCQHPAQKHFGLGAETSVEEIRIIWPNGKSSMLASPQINTYHAITAPMD